MSEHTTMPASLTHEVDESKGQISSGTAALATAGMPLQSFKPLGGICEAWCGIHLYPNDTNRQVISYHYCSMLDEDRRQCLVYDSNSEHAKLIAVEYIISEKLFELLNEDEKKFWHSHKYECESGMLVQIAKSMIPEKLISTAEIPALQNLCNTYGKTIQLWPVDDQGNCSSHVPCGPPQMLASFTADGQVRPDVLERRDKEMGIDTEKKRKEREGHVQGNQPAKGSDQWYVRGKAWQIYDQGDRGTVEQ